MHGNTTATAGNIAAHASLLRLGIVSDLFCGTLLIFLVLALYRLLQGVDRNHAVLMVILWGVLPAAIDFLNVVEDRKHTNGPGEADRFILSRSRAVPGEVLWSCSLRLSVFSSWARSPPSWPRLHRNWLASAV